MAAQPAKRIPLVVTTDNRDETTSFDARLINAYVEKTAMGELWAVKRPGLTSYSTGSAAAGAGIYNWKGNIYSIRGNTLYKDNVPVSGTVDTTGGVYTFSACLGGTPRLFFQNGVSGYVYDTVNGLIKVSTLTISGVTCTTNSTVNLAAITGTVQPQIGQTLNVGADFALGTFVIAVGGISGAWTATLSTAALTTGAGKSATFTGSFPNPPVKGLAYLDGTTYIMDAKANIWGSALNNQTSWDALNQLVAQIEPDGGVDLAKQLVYVVALKQWTYEAFYDAGNTVGSPLGPVQGAKGNYGCRHAGSVQEMDGMLFWLTSTRSGSVGVMMMDSVKAQPISTPAIERLLQNADYTTVYSWTARLDGHKYYGVTLKGSNLTLVYDHTTGAWQQWQDGNGNYLPIVSSTFSVAQQPLLQHESNGGVYTFDATVYADDGVLFTVEAYTPNFDGETNKRKMVVRMYVIADRTAGSNVQIRFSDDDYKTWSNPCTVDLSLDKPAIDSMGTFTKRAHHVRHKCNTPLRLKALELNLLGGSL